ncbi:MAG: DUF4847 domain-containing protein [Mediterranea sp.]|jgi:hypothetical protein|nr:DUF4847 domain-containing protein [Mediterranea sp.]
MMKNVFRLLGLCALIHLMAGCEQADDVKTIFGRTWKLTYITLDGKHQMFDFWAGDEAAMRKSMEQLNKPGNYTLLLDGLTEGDDIRGNASGSTVSPTTFSGTWSANGRTNAFKATVTGNRPDVLAVKFLEGLNAATSYEGDTQNLYLIYTAGQQTFRMCFKASNQ